jgi:MoaD family protein
MKISIRGFLTLKKVMDAQTIFDFEGDILTVEGLIKELSARYGDAFKKMILGPKTKVLSPHIRILVNGRHYSHLPGKLKTRLNEGDEVSLFPPIAGG